MSYFPALNRDSLRLEISTDRDITVQEVYAHKRFFIDSTVEPTGAYLTSTATAPWNLTGKTELSTEDDFNGVIDQDLSGQFGDPSSVSQADLESAMQNTGWPSFSFSQDTPSPDLFRVLGDSSVTQIRAVTPSGGSGNDANTVIGFETSYQYATAALEVKLPNMGFAGNGIEVEIWTTSDGNTITLKVENGDGVSTAGELNAGQGLIFVWHQESAISDGYWLNK